MASRRHLPGLGVSFSFVQSQPGVTHNQLLQVDWGRQAPRLYRVWAVCRITGRWPLQVLGQDSAPVYLEQCAACGASNVDVMHAIAACPVNTPHLWEAVPALRACRTAQSGVVDLLFSHSDPDGQQCRRIVAVAHAFLRCIGSAAYEVEAAVALDEAPRS